MSRKPLPRATMSRFTGYRTLCALTNRRVHSPASEAAFEKIARRGPPLHEFVWKCIENVNALTGVELLIMTEVNSLDRELDEYIEGVLKFKHIYGRLRVIRALLDRRLQDRTAKSAKC